MALSDPFMGSALYDPFSLFLGTPIGGGGQVSSSRGVLEQRLRPIHLDVKGCPFLFFLFLCFFPFCSFPSRSIQVSLKGKELAGKRGRMEADFAEKAKQRRRRSRFVVAASHRRVVVAGNACIQTRTLSSTTLLILSSPPPPNSPKKRRDRQGVRDSRRRPRRRGLPRQPLRRRRPRHDRGLRGAREEEDPQARYYRSERSASFQSRSVRLPPSAKMDELKADFEHGVLHVRVPKEKKGEKGPRRIKIGG